jgi:hypothetical protein
MADADWLFLKRKFDETRFGHVAAVDKDAVLVCVYQGEERIFCLYCACEGGCGERIAFSPRAPAGIKKLCRRCTNIEIIRAGADFLGFAYTEGTLHDVQEFLRKRTAENA